MKKFLTVLKKCALFSDISNDDLLRMLSCLGAKIECFDKKLTVFPEGSYPRLIGIVLSGEVQITQSDYYGNRSIIGLAGEGEVFCEDFACCEISSLPVAVTASEYSEVMLIDSRHIIHTCQNNCGFHQKLIFNLMRDLAEKTLAYHKRMEIISKRSTREKLLAYLMFQAKKEESSNFTIPLDRQELADYLEVDRSGLSVEIGKLKKEGVINTNKNYFELKQPVKH